VRESEREMESERAREREGGGTRGREGYVMALQVHILSLVDMLIEKAIISDLLMGMDNGVLLRDLEFLL
jgi:hypothetical protein